MNAWCRSSWHEREIFKRKCTLIINNESRQNMNVMNVTSFWIGMNMWFWLINRYILPTIAYPFFVQYKLFSQGVLARHNLVTIPTKKLLVCASISRSSCKSHRSDLENVARIIQIFALLTVRFTELGVAPTPY